MSGLFGGGGKDPNEEAMKQQEEQLRRLQAIDIPDIEKQRILLENPELIGLLEAEELAPSKMEEISLDPELRANQLKALESLSQRAEEGLTSEDKYAMEQLLGDVAAQERSQLASIESEMARRGMESSGAAERAKREALQGGANAARERAMQMAAQGQQNRMQALQALGQQSGQMQAQDYAQQAQIASARDAIAQANAANRQNVAAQNLAARQNIENQRANLANQQEMYNKGLIQQQFQNKMAKATGQGDIANQMSQIAANTPKGPSGLQQVATIGGGVIGGIYGGPAGAAAGAQAGSAIGGMFADGGIAKKPEYACGGVHNKAEDGALFVSSGEGEIVDTGADSLAGDRIDAKLNDKEAVLNVPQQQRLMDMIRGKISVEELGDDDIIEGVPRDYRDSLHEKIESEDKESSKMKGLEKLIEMLGK